MVKPDLIPALEDLLLDLNRVSADAILPLFRSDHGLEDKGGEAGFDPVTMADRGAEAAIRRRLAEVVPEHGVIGEEYGEDRPDQEFVWVLDPVDGTRAFIAGLPVWTTLISLRWRGEPILSSIGQPYLGEVFIGSPTGSRLVRGGEVRPLRVRPCFGLSEIPSPTSPQTSVKPGTGSAQRPGWPGWGATPTPTPWWRRVRSTWSWSRGPASAGTSRPRRPSWPAPAAP